MAEKRLTGRLVNKHDTAANWARATTFVPMAGELIVYDVDSTYSYERLKVGDGTTLVNALPFVDDALRTELIAHINDVDDKVDAISVLVGDTAVSEQITTAIAEKADIANGQYAVTATSDDGVAYSATVPGVTALTTGMSFIMIPGKTSTSVTPTINVNGLGDKPIRRKLSNIYASVQNGYAASWLYTGVPFRLIYDGRAKIGTITGCWIVEGCNKPSASDLYGSVTDAKNATNDGEGQEIAATYIKGLAVGADAITYTLGDGNTGTVSLNALIQALLPKVTSITLSANSWNGSAAPYYQDITSSYVTQTSKVDIQPTAEQLAEWQNEGLAFSTLSFEGSFRVYVSDVKPTVDYTVQVTMQEMVEV